MFDREHRTLACVPRWPILRVNRRQSVAEHSFYVALYAAEIAHAIYWDGSFEQLMLHSLTHDLDEIVTGDINSPTKRAMDPGMRAQLAAWTDKKMRERAQPDSAWAIADPGEQAKIIVKLADMVEGILYLADERSSGNGNTKPLEMYLWSHLRRFWQDVFVPAFKLDCNRLGVGGILWDKIIDASESAANGHDRLVSE